MMGANLIPAARREAKRRRTRRRVWIAACGVYATLLLAGYGLCAAVWGTDGRGLDEHLRNEDTDIAASKAELGTLHRKLEQASQRLQANRAVGDQPDWSVLLAVLAKSLDDELVLTRCRLREPEPPAPPQSRQGRLVLTISGYGSSQAAVSRFVLRLERGPLFKTVHLLKANREPFLTDSAVAFRVECSL